MFASGLSVNALMVVDILVVLEGIPVADLLDMTAVVPRIDRNNAAVALLEGKHISCRLFGSNVYC